MSIPDHERARLGQMVRQAGAIFEGIQERFRAGYEPLVLFTHPTTLSTLSLPLSKVTVEAIQRRLLEHQQSVSTARRLIHGGE